MEKCNSGRRKFIKETIAASIAVSMTPALLASGKVYNQSLPTAILGKTGVKIPRIGLGLGSRFCGIEDLEKSSEILNYALDNGLYYWDTAYTYGNKKNGVFSEERIGEVAKYRRKEIFISTKVSSRNPDEAMREFEESLKRLQTDKVDMLKIHSVQTMSDVNQLNEVGGLVELLHKLKEQGLTRFIGFSGHSNAEAMKVMAERANMDSMLIAMNHFRMDEAQKREELVIPAALANNMGVMLMKVVRPKEYLNGLDPKELIRFALSLNGPTGLVLGIDSLDILKSNIEILRNFILMNESEKKAFAQSLSPFYRHQNLEWMGDAYQDGNWA